MANFGSLATASPITKRRRDMSTPIFQLDAFTSRRFAGNPAAVVPVPGFPPAHVMQAIAAENNLAETAFIVLTDGGDHIRWFTPTTEVPLCGHATLASAAVVMERLRPGADHVVFQSASGPLPVWRTPSGYVKNFPARPMVRIELLPALRDALHVDLMEVFTDPVNYVVRLGSADAVRTIAPDLGAIARLDRTGVIVTAEGDEGYDFVSRYFAPRKGIPEDPVTGGAHCTLAPYWAGRLGRTTLRAFQASARGGEIQCRVVGDRVELEGRCVFYLQGQIDF
jgi:PhzF family phenazine biosynthesis protein